MIIKTANSPPLLCAESHLMVNDELQIHEQTPTTDGETDTNHQQMKSAKERNDSDGYACDFEGPFYASSPVTEHRRAGKLVRSEPE